MVDVLAREIQPHHFRQRDKGNLDPAPLPGEVFSWQMQHLRAYRGVPSYDLTRMRWPLFELIETTDTLGALVEAFVADIKRRELIEHIRHLSAVADDPARVVDAEMYAFEGAAALARAVPALQITRLSDSLNRLELYEERERTGVVPGISLMLDKLNDLTYGAQRHEMVVIEAFLGQKKSSLLMAICAEAYLKRDKTPLVFSLEMEGDKLQQRWDAMMADFKYGALKRAELTEGDKDKWKRWAEKAHESRFDKDVWVIDDIRHPTEDRIYAEIERWRPDFTVVDTLDEVRAPAYLKTLHEKQDHIARELKAIARTTKRTMFVAAQANRDAAKDGATLDNIAGSITIARKADIAIGLHATPEMKKRHMCQMTLLKNRDDGGEGTQLNTYFNPGTMELRPWLPTDNVPLRPETPSHTPGAVPA